MKKLIALLLIAALLIPFACVAETAAEPFAVGSVYHGFKVFKTAAIDYMDVDLYFMEHEATGAQLIYADCDSIDRTFCVGFRTQAINDEGLPHVFEHSTLSGSEKYPDPNLMFNMMNQTLQSYLNAVTFQNMTLFPCASLSEEQLFAYMDVYMDGVLHPVLLNDEHAMMREAYHYSLDDPDGEIGLSGVVYSEMQGASNGVLMSGMAHAKKELFPNSRYSNNSGGDPERIPEMQYRELLDFHEKYYHPSNMLMMLYGDFEDVERFLKRIDGEYLSGYERREITLDDPGYTPIEGLHEAVYEYPVPASGDDENGDASCIFYACALEGADRRDTQLAVLAANVLNAQTSPLVKLVDERLPGRTLAISIDSLAPAPMICFRLQGAGPEDAQIFKETIDEGLNILAENGVDQSIITSIINQNLLQEMQAGEMGSAGVTLAENFAAAWAAENRPDAYLDDVAVTKQLGTYRDDGTIDGIIRKYFRVPENAVLVTEKPVPGLYEQKEAERAQKLADMKAAMSKEEIDALIAKTREYEAWLEKTSETSLIDSVKVVDVDTLPEEYPVAQAVDTTEGGVRRIRSEIANDQLFFTNIYLDLSSFTLDELMRADIMMMMFAGVGTENYTKEELMTELYNRISGLGMVIQNLHYEDRPAQPYLTIGLSGLSAQMPDTYELMEEILFRTDFKNYGDIRMQASQYVSYIDILMDLRPSDAVAQLTYAVLDDDYYSDYVRAYAPEYIDFFHKVASADDEEMALIAEDFDYLRNKMLRNGATIVTQTGTPENMDASDALADAFIAKLPAIPEGEKAEDTASPLGRHVAMPVSGTMQYNYLGLNLRDAGVKADGKMMVANALVSDVILLPELRFRKNAYGAGASNNEDLIFMYSYRDPNLAETYDTFAGVGERLREMELTQEQIDGYIISIYAGLSYPEGPITRAKRAVNEALVHCTEANRTERYIREIKNTTVEDVRGMADIYDRMTEEGSRVAGVSETQLKLSPELFDQVIGK